MMSAIARILVLLILVAPLPRAWSQVTSAMFRACERNCGVYQEKEHISFENEIWKFKTGGKIFSSPAVFGETVYIGSEDENVYALNKSTGKIQWKFKTGGAVHSSPAYYKNTVYAGSFDGYYYAIDATTGKQKWRFKTGGERWIGGNGYLGMKPDSMFMADAWDYFLSSPVMDPDSNNEIVFFGSSDGHLYAVNAKNGSLKWKFRTDGIIHATPAIHKGRIYIGSFDTHMYCLDVVTGKEVWRFKTGDRQGMSGIQASPVIANNSVYFGARDAHFYSLDAGTGALKWKYFADNSWIINSAAAENGVVYFGTSDSYLMIALDANTGTEKWKTALNGYVYSSPALAGNTLIVGDFTGTVYLINARDGDIRDTFTTDGQIQNKSILTSDGKMDFMKLLNGKDGTLYSSTVGVMNEFYKLGPFVSSPVIIQDVMYIGSADGNFYAVQLRPGYFPPREGLSPKRD